MLNDQPRERCDAHMKTRITLEPDVAVLVEQAMTEHGLTFNETANRAIRNSLGRRRPRYETPTASMDTAIDVDLDRSLAIVATMEDQEIARELLRAK